MNKKKPYSSHPYFRFVDDVDPLQGNGAEVEVASRPKGRHHIGNDDVQRILVTGIHVWQCVAQQGNH